MMEMCKTVSITDMAKEFKRTSGGIKSHMLEIAVKLTQDGLTLENAAEKMGVTPVELEAHSLEGHSLEGHRGRAARGNERPRRGRAGGLPAWRAPCSCLTRVEDGGVGVGTLGASEQRDHFE